LSDHEHRLLLSWNSTSSHFPSHLCVHQLFERQAHLAPLATAASHLSSTISFDSLNRRANQLAHLLRSRGAGPESLVAICADASSASLPPLPATLNAAAPSLPPHPSYPPHRLSFMLSDPRPTPPLPHQPPLPRLPRPPSPLILLDPDQHLFRSLPDHDPLPSAS